MEKDNSLKYEINAESIRHYGKTLKEIQNRVIELNNDLSHFFEDEPFPVISAVCITWASFALRKIHPEKSIREECLKESIGMLIRNFKIMEELSDDNFDGMPTFYGEEELNDRQD